MKKHRCIGRLDIKGKSVIKGIQYEGTRVVGNPTELLEFYSSLQLDEIFIVDTIATHFSTRSNIDFINNSSNNLPLITIGGGIKNLIDAERYFKLGADKVCINSYLFENFSLLRELISEFGSQSVSVSVQVGFNANTGKFSLYSAYGRDIKEDFELIDWVNRIYEEQAGELILCNINSDGLCTGIDSGLLKSIPKSEMTNLIYSGGVTYNELTASSESQYDGLMAATCLQRLYKSNRHDYAIVSSTRTYREHRIQDIEAKDIKIHILDLGMCNILKLSKSLKLLTPHVTASHGIPEAAKNTILVLPGVGSFSAAMDIISREGISEAIKSYLDSGGKLLGICLGMQLLFESSDEDLSLRETINLRTCRTSVKGLNIFKGHISSLPKGIDRLPNIGYRTIENISQNTHESCYFCHSYALPRDKEVVSQFDEYSISTFNNSEFISHIKTKNIFAFQFHPEFSGAGGIDILQRAVRTLISV